MCISKVERPKILRADTARNLKADGQGGIWEWMLLKKPNGFLTLIIEGSYSRQGVWWMAKD
jgi:hypothetical protein